MSFRLKASTPDSGQTIEARIRRDSDGDWLDFDDDTFKSSGHVDDTIGLSEPNASSFPGFYQTAEISPSGWPDGDYTAFLTESTGRESFAPVELPIRDGRLVGNEDTQVQGVVRLRSSNSDLEILLWLLIDGQIHTSPTSATVTIYNSDGTTFVAAISDSSADGQGVFQVEKASSSVSSDTAYYAIAEIVAGGETYKGPVAFVVY